MGWLTRIAAGGSTRAAAPAVSQNARPPRGGNQSVFYSTPGQPQYPTWDGHGAINNGYLASVYIMQPVRCIATALGGLPFRVGADPDKPGDYDRNAPLARLLGPPPGGPNPVTSTRNLWVWSLVQRLVTGATGWETISAPGFDAPVAFWPLVAPFLRPVPAPRGAPRWFDGYEYQLPSGVVKYRADDVFYSWRPAQMDWRQPESALQAAGLPASLQIALDRYMWALAKNGMTARKLIVTPPFAADDERRAWQDQFLSEFTGYDNGGKVAFSEYDDDSDLGAGPAGARAPAIQAIDLATTPVDAQVLEILKEVKDDLNIAWRVPRSMIGDSSRRTYENADQEHRNFWTGPVMELAAEVADDVNQYLAPRFGDGNVGWFDFSRVEALKRSSVFGPIAPDAAVKAGLATADDWRNDVGLAPLDPADADNILHELPVEDDTPGVGPASNFKRAAGASGGFDVRTDSAGHPVGARYDVSPLGTSKSWVTDVGGLPLFARAVAHALIRDGHSESEAIQLAIGTIQRWARGGGKVSEKTRAKAAAALAEWEAKKAAAHATPNKRDAALSEGSSAGLLLPKGPMPAVHVFAPGKANRRVCGKCGRRVTARTHHITGRRDTGDGDEDTERVRHRGPGHPSVPTGHAPSIPRLRARTRRLVDSHAATLEPQLAVVIAALFVKQGRATADRVAGRRGAQMIRAAQGDSQPPAGVDAGMVFDLAHWMAETRAALNPVYAAVTALTVVRLGDDLHPKDGVFGDAQAAARAALDARGSKLADTVTRTTYNDVQAALAQGVAAGDGVQGLAARVRGVFTDASQTRAETIARTEVIGSLNAAADAYATALPSTVVAAKEWLATPDQRTRPDHREADGQRRNVREPFLVGGFPMLHPGDLAAPPSETINCRCTTVYLAARMANPATVPLAS